MPESTEKSVEDLKYDPSSLPGYLPIYYKFLFPFGSYYSWLSYGGFDGKTMSNREFSFTLKDDIYVRYQSFTNQQEMEREIQKETPYKIDLGAIYTHPPKDHNKFSGNAFRPVEKELVFDIDMTDYDDVRGCCKGADICKRCWPLMSMAIRLLDKALREDFGFEHRLWVYSGRRGVHCWVCDESARKLPNKARSAIVEYLSIIQGGNTDKRVALKDPVHPFVRDSIKTIKNNYWFQYCELQDIFGTSENLEKVLKMVADDEIKEELRKALSDSNDSIETKWDKLNSVIAKRFQSDMKKHKKLHFALWEIILEFCYPRLDANVSTGINHLLKSPFCVHPKTGRVCVPIDISKVDEFDPFSVPTVSQLCYELDSQKADDATDTQTRRTQMYMKTSLAPYMKVFENFVHNLLASARKGRANKGEPMTF